MNILFFSLYRMFVSPLMLFSILVMAPFHPKIRDGLKLRLKSRPRALAKSLNGQRPWWIHCASGEFEYAKPVIAELKRRFPEIPVVVTYFSPSFAQAIAKHPLVDVHLPLPLDLPGPVQTFLQAMNPRALLISRTDLWPEILRQCKSRDIPRILIAARKTSAQIQNPIRRSLQKWTHQNLSAIYCVSQEDQHNFKRLIEGSNVAVEVAGDPRYDQVFARLESPKPIRQELFLKSSETPVLIAGSTWTEDERVLLDATHSFIQQKKLKLILVPHEPTASHIQELQSLLSQFHLTPQLYSSTHSSSWDVLIVDRVGILAELYQCADFAFVGGGFGKGVHSVMEPLACGIPTMAGPHSLGSREVLEFKEVQISAKPHLMAVTLIRDAADCKEQIQRWLRVSDPIPMRQRIVENILNRRGASANIAQRLQTFAIT